jgi:hypothetical protein
MLAGHPAKIVDQVTVLLGVPPPQWLDLHPVGPESRHRVLHLNLLSAMCQVEGQSAVEQDFHLPDE